MKRILITACSLLCLTLPAQAAIQRSADFSAGQTLGLGLYGASYDYGIGGFSAGLAISGNVSSSLLPDTYNPLKSSLRLMGRFYQQDGLSAAVLGGVQFDPGIPGNRAYLTPDLGVGVAYDFRQFEAPFVVRLNVSLALREDRFYASPGPEAVTQSGNFFQRLGFGPQTSLELAWLPSDNLEVTLGGGTLLGMRLIF
ncbi:MAG: hypothetical protein ACO1RX_03575 [Candidatus Sericytochromatia bacterium]